MLPMHRLTARLLLILLLVGTFAPTAMAISTPPPHACCMRKPMHNHGAPGSEFRALDCGRRNCCGPLTVSHWAHPRPSLTAGSASLTTTLLSDLRVLHRATQLQAALSVRGPPVL